MDEVDDEVGRRFDPRLKALWIFAIVLVGSGLLLTVGVQTVYASQVITDPGGIEQFVFAILQVGSAVGPSLLTSGLIAAAIAFALRAILGRLDSWGPQTGLAVPASDDRDDSVDHGLLDPQDVILGTPHDRRLFMRPEG